MQKRPPNPLVPITALTAAIYLVINMMIPIQGLWWLVAFMAFPVVMYVSTFLTAFIFPSMFFPEKAPDDAPTVAASGHMFVIDTGPQIGVYLGEPIYDYMTTLCSDGATRKFTFKGTVSEEPDDPPADRWFVTMGCLYIFNEPNQSVSHPENTVQ